MGENNNKPIGFTQIVRPYEDSRSALRGFTGFVGAIWGLAFNRKIFHMGLPIGKSVRPGPGRPVHLFWSAYRACVRCSGRTPEG